jgi:hypothetical protein
MTLPNFNFELTLDHQAAPEMLNNLEPSLERSEQVPVAPSITATALTQGFDDLRAPTASNGLFRGTEAVRFRMKTKTVFECTYEDCNKEFSRKGELHRHHRSVHSTQRPFRCHDTGCLRSINGFPRRDKRDDHERKVHGLVRAKGYGRSGF